jgi:hypothetical protein
VTLVDRATNLLKALATSDLERVSKVSASDVLIYGTDLHERWSRLDDVLVALEGMRSLNFRANWSAPPASGSNWVAGIALYESPTMPPLPVRVTMVFRGNQLIHGHFSVEAAPVSPS